MLSCEVAYALCPASLTHGQVKSLCSASNDFAYGEPGPGREVGAWEGGGAGGGALALASQGVGGSRPCMHLGMTGQELGTCLHAAEGQRQGGKEGRFARAQAGPTCTAAGLLHPVHQEASPSFLVLSIASARGPSRHLLLVGVQLAGWQARAAQQGGSLLQAPPLPLSASWSGQAQVPEHVHVSPGKMGEANLERRLPDLAGWRGSARQTYASGQSHGSATACRARSPLAPGLLGRGLRRWFRAVPDRRASYPAQALAFTPLPRCTSAESASPGMMSTCAPQSTFPSSWWEAAPARKP